MVSGSCKRLIEQKAQDMVVSAMTNGRWYVEQYKVDSTDVTGNFFGYEFQFYSDGRVDGINTAGTKSGTWSGDASSRTITASFPPAAGDTLALLSHTWKIKDSYVDYVVANTTTPTSTNILHLRKK